MLKLQKILVLSLLLTITHTFTYGAGLNTDVALTPPEGGTVIRTQWRNTKLSPDSSLSKMEVDLHAFPVTAVHGITADFAAIISIPTIQRTVRIKHGNTFHDRGIGDIPVLGKYRFYQNDQPGRTTRWAVIGGVELPSFDNVFSSESVDPVIGTVWTHQRLEWWVDWNLQYQFNTGSGIHNDDALRVNAAASYPLRYGEQERSGSWRLYAIGEVNGLFLTDGSKQMLVSPGLQLITARWIMEGGIQLPVHQNMKSPRLDTDMTMVFSFRFQY